MPYYKTFRDWQIANRNGGPSLAQALPGNLSVLGPAFRRSRGPQGDGIDSQSLTPAVPHATSYDPNKFVYQGNAATTPGANAAVAGQSQVIKTGAELKKAYESELAATNKAQTQNRELQRLWNAYKSGQSNFSEAIQSNLGGRRVANPGDPITAGQPLLPGAVANFRIDPIDSTGQNYLGLPDSFVGQPGWDTAVGNQYTPSENRTYADQMATMVRDQMRAGQPVVLDSVVGPDPMPLPTMSRYSAANGDGLLQRQNVRDALTTWVDANKQMQNTPTDYLGRPMGLNPQGGGSGGSDTKALSDSWNTYQQNYNNTKITENQSYLDMLGGGFFGGVVPSATNPQWYDNTPQWAPPKDNFGRDQLRNRAAASPWGQPGAPWQSQAWAAGTYNPSQSPIQPAGPDGKIQDAPGWEGSWNMFDPQQGFSPELVTNSPWTPQKKQNNAFGATSTPGMTFGASPWGSFW
jgi:hypothetical protein